MGTIHKATANVVKVSIGPATGNRVARFIRRDGIIPEGVEPEQLERLTKLGLIEKITVEDGPTDAEVAAAAQAEAKAKAAADAKATAEAKAKAAAEAKASAAAAAAAAADKK